MNILGALKKLSTALLSISFLYFMVMPILNFMGVQIPHDVTNLTSSMILLITIALMVALLLTFGLGYCALTGWRNYKALPKVIRILLAFILGIAIFFLQGPMAMLIPVPFLPLLIVTVLLWTVLRALSNFLVKGGEDSTQEEAIDLGKAFSTAYSFLRKLVPAEEELVVEESKMVGDAWEIVLSTTKSGKYKIRVDRFGGVTSCEKLP